jgi:hypothetical protein
MAAYIAGTFYATMAVAGFAVELLFRAAGLVPRQRHAKVVEAHISWDYTTLLNIVFLVLAAILVARFLTTGGPAMLQRMGGASPGPSQPEQHEHNGHEYQGHNH